MQTPSVGLIVLHQSLAFCAKVQTEPDSLTVQVREMQLVSLLQVHPFQKKKVCPDLGKWGPKMLNRSVHRSLMKLLEVPFSGKSSKSMSNCVVVF